MTMSDKTTLVVPGQKLAVPRLVKRLIQVGVSVGLTCAVALVFVMGSAFVCQLVNSPASFTSFPPPA